MASSDHHPHPHHHPDIPGLVTRYRITTIYILVALTLLLAVAVWEVVTDVRAFGDCEPPEGAAICCTAQGVAGGA